MSISMQGRLHWRNTAPFHIQIALQKAQGNHQKDDQGYTRIEGTVVSVFRSDGRLSIGDPVAFHLWICQPGDEPTGPPCIYCEDFINADYMEVYLLGNPPECHLAGEEFHIFSSPTEKPMLAPGELEDLIRKSSISRCEIGPEKQKPPKTKKWYQFWRV